MLTVTELAQTLNRSISQRNNFNGYAKLGRGRLQLKVTSIELDGNIIPADITIYDLDGQQGLYVPHSHEMNVLTECILAI
jgi:hypothetical protein